MAHRCWLKLRVVRRVNQSQKVDPIWAILFVFYCPGGGSVIEGTEFESGMHPPPFFSLFFSFFFFLKLPLIVFSRLLSTHHFFPLLIYYHLLTSLGRKLFRPDVLSGLSKYRIGLVRWYRQKAISTFPFPHEAYERQEKEYVYY